MTMRDGCDERLESLPRLRPDAARAESVRRRCRARVREAQMMRRSRARATDTLARRLDRVFLPALLVAFSAFYAAALVGTTLRVERLLR